MVQRWSDLKNLEYLFYGSLNGPSLKILDRIY